MNNSSTGKKLHHLKFVKKFSHKCIKGPFIALTLLCSMTPGHLYANTSFENPAAVISRGNMERLLGNREFKSKEELFQLLYMLYSQESAKDIILMGEPLEFLKSELKTLFPLKGCNLIELKNGRVVFLFAKPQKVVIPNTWWQAYLLVPNELVLRIKKEDSGRINPEENVSCNAVESSDSSPTTSHHAISFEIEKGYIRVHFSFMLKVFGDKLRDADGSELVYQVNESQKTSQLRLIEKMPIDRKNLEIVPSPSAKAGLGYTWVDIKHPDFPGQKDVGFFKNWISFFGEEVELLPDYMVRIKGEGLHKNRFAWEFFNNFKYFKEFAETGILNSKLDYQRTLAYYFEEQRVFINLGFNSSPVTN